MPFLDWSPFQRPLAVNIPITATTVRLDFPPGRYLVNDPVVLVTVVGDVTTVDITSPPELVSGLGEVHTHVVLTFPMGLVGKRVNVYVVGP